MPKNLVSLIIVIVLAIAAGVFCMPKYVNNGIDFINSQYGWKLPKLSDKPFKLGLDVKGGVRLEYEADLSNIPENERANAMNGLRDLIERRINVYGVAEPQIQVSGQNRLIVELPGIESIQQAIDWIGATPWLQFLEERTAEESQPILDKIKEVQEAQAAGKTTEEIMQIKDVQLALENPYFKPTELTGQYLKKPFCHLTRIPMNRVLNCSLTMRARSYLNKITERNVGKPLAIFLDGQSIIDTDGDGTITAADMYAPRVQEKISGGNAVITGEKNVVEAKTLVNRLNQGALPVPLGQPISQEKIGPTLGSISFDETVKAAIIGFLAVIAFMIIYYRLPGFLSALALSIYVVLMLAISNNWCDDESCRDRRIYSVGGHGRGRKRVDILAHERRA